MVAFHGKKKINAVPKVQRVEAVRDVSRLDDEETRRFVHGGGELLRAVRGDLLTKRAEDLQGNTPGCLGVTQKSRGFFVDSYVDCIFLFFSRDCMIIMPLQG